MIGYDDDVTYETTVTELFERFPGLRETYQTQFEYMSDEKPEPYIVFGSLLIPTLETALEAADLRSILSICAFLEDAAESARKDTGLETLVKIEVGEWLG
jgi:hypothetical protein